MINKVERVTLVKWKESQRPRFQSQVSEVLWACFLMYVCVCVCVCVYVHGHIGLTLGLSKKNIYIFFIYIYEGLPWWSSG